jgi:hypothetical protein
METKKATKPYPSQINTKTISCRISATDYVKFLEDALSKGITLNDWLLMKIYSNSLGKVSEIEENAAKNEEYEFTPPDFTFPMQFNSQWGELNFENEEEIGDFIENCYYKLYEMHNMYLEEGKKRIEAQRISAESLKSNDLIRLSIFNSLREVAREIEWETPADKKAVLKDISTLYKDLFGE